MRQPKAYPLKDIAELPSIEPSVSNLVNQFQIPPTLFKTYNATPIQLEIANDCIISGHIALAIAKKQNLQEAICNDLSSKPIPFLLKRSWQMLTNESLIYSGTSLHLLSFVLKQNAEWLQERDLTQPNGKAITATFISSFLGIPNSTLQSQILALDKNLKIF
ncbi:hypothetical protein AAOGI_22700 [Agarivorans albus]